MAQIRYVLAAARALNFTKAAQDCNVSQPAMTKAVKALEEELGGLIFHREGKRILLSEFGRSMLPRLQRIVDETEAAHALANNYRLLKSAPVRLGVMSTIGYGRLARFLGKVEREHQGVELSLSELPIAELKQQLDSGDLDVAIVNPLPGIGDAYRIIKLYDETYVVVLPPGHRLSEHNTIALAELSGEAYVDRLACEMREVVMATCMENKVELYARFRSEREDWVQAMVREGIGFAFVPEYAVSVPGLVQRPLVEPRVTRSIGLATVVGRQFSSGVKAFMQAAQAYPWHT
ncbi:MAG: LysR family transcriptional regulator [Hyphomicrobiaceae bacterium]